MEHQTLVDLFLGVIALASLLQAGFVAALAFGVRQGGRKLAEAEGRLGRDVLPRIQQFSLLARRAADMSARGVEQAQRMDAVVADAAGRVERFVDRTSARVERLAGCTRERIVEGVRHRASRTRLGRTFARASAVARGVRQAVDVWQHFQADTEAPPNGGSEEEEAPIAD
jgi:hypothetical protein